MGTIHVKCIGQMAARGEVLHIIREEIAVNTIHIALPDKLTHLKLMSIFSVAGS